MFFIRDNYYHYLAAELYNTNETPTQPNIYKSHWSKYARMSKAALNIAAVSLARDLTEDNIAVGIYHPGYVQTEMVNRDGVLSNGDISANEAAERLIALMDNLSMADSGVFKHSNGETLPW